MRILIGLIWVTVCSAGFPGVDPEPAAAVPHGGPFSGVAGQYRGHFSGDDTGTWVITIAADGTVTGTSTSDTYGPERISGSLSGGRQLTITGVSDTTVFSGHFGHSGEVSGTWQDDEDATGTFAGRRVASPTSTPTTQAAGAGSLRLSGADAGVIGAEFVPNTDVATVADPTALSGKVSIIWNQYFGSTSPAGMESRSIYLAFNEVDGRVYRAGYLRLPLIDMGSRRYSYYNYTLGCEENKHGCESIIVDIRRREVTFNNAMLAADGDSKATASMVFNGTLTW